MSRLKQFDKVALEAGVHHFRYPDGMLLVLKRDEAGISLSLLGADGTSIGKMEKLDAHQEITIGRSKSTLTVPAEFNTISGSQAKIRYENGVVVYEHCGRNDIDHERAAKVRPRVQGGCVSEKGGYREENQDRVGSFPLPPMDAGTAREYLRQLYKEKLVPLAQGAQGGSTLTMLMPVKDGGYACGFVGDSPVYMVVQAKDGEVEMHQLFLPHNEKGYYMRACLGAAPTNEPTQILAAKAAARYRGGESKIIDPKIDDTTFVDHNSGGIFYNITQKAFDAGGLGEMLEMQRFDPLPYLEPDAKLLGMMVCSDGITTPVEIGDVQKALTEALKADPGIGAREFSRVAVQAALASSRGGVPCTQDNVSVAYLPVGAQEMAVVADGNRGGKENVSGRTDMPERLIVALVKATSRYRTSQNSATIDLPARR